MFTSYPTTVTDLLNRVRASRAALEAVLAPLTEADLSRPGPDGGWAVKDHLAHLAAWMRKQLALIDGRPGWEGLGVDQEIYHTGDIDRVNAELARRFQSLTAGEALAEFHNAYAEMVARLQTMTDADLRRPNNQNDLEDKRMLIEGIASNTYEHDDEHRGWIEEILS